MKRASLYASQDAIDTFDDAVNRVVDALGGGVPRHIAVSALLEAAAHQADTVTTSLAKQRATELAEQLARLERRTGRST
jgi:hypothetical protein